MERSDAAARSRGVELGLAALVALSALACSSESAPPQPPAQAVSAKAAAPAAASAGDEPRLKFEDASGKELLKLKAREGGYRIHDGADASLGEVKVQADRVKLKDASDVEIRKVKRKERGAEIEDAAGTRLYRIKEGDPGEWKLTDARDATLVKCKPKETGYEVRDAAGRTLAKVKVREGRLAFETEGGERLHVLKGTTDARAGMWLAAEPLTLLERAALVVYFSDVQGPGQDF
jgi:hypothetical protein